MSASFKLCDCVIKLYLTYSSEEGCWSVCSVCTEKKKRNRLFSVLSSLVDIQNFFPASAIWHKVVRRNVSCINLQVSYLHWQNYTIENKYLILCWVKPRLYRSDSRINLQYKRLYAHLCLPTLTVVELMRISFGSSFLFLPPHSQSCTSCCYRSLIPIKNKTIWQKCL